MLKKSQKNKPILNSPKTGSFLDIASQLNKQLSVLPVVKRAHRYAIKSLDTYSKDGKLPQYYEPGHSEIKTEYSSEGEDGLYELLEKLKLWNNKNVSIMNVINIQLTSYYSCYAVAS